MLSRVYLIVLGSLGVLTVAAQQPELPACNAVTMGKLWPMQANGDRRLTNKLFNCGELRVCTRGRWKYRWSPFSVRFDQLTGSSRKAPPACAALMDELGRAEQNQQIAHDPALAQTATGADLEADR